MNDSKWPYGQTVLGSKFEFWQRHAQNVLLIGRSGVGKTELIREGLEKFGYKFGENAAYYSSHANDFVGDPTTAKVLVFDNLNDPQAQKAANEVLGLRVWKGKPVTAFAWGAFTIESVEKVEVPGKRFDVTRCEYDVTSPPELLAQAFQVAVEVPYKPRLAWFEAQFGSRLTQVAFQWWEELDETEQHKVSPRRLADALKLYTARGDIRDVLPISSNVSKLMTGLNVGPVTERLEDLLKSGDKNAAKTFLANENNYVAAMKYIPSSEPFKAFYLPLLNKEKLAALLADDEKVCSYIIANTVMVPEFMGVVKEVLNANVNNRLCKKIRRALVENQALADSFSQPEAPALGAVLEEPKK